MCERCDQPIKSEELKYLPFTVYKWHCIIPGCINCTKVRDYGLFPHLYWPVVIRPTKIGWRGGWFDSYNHYYFCSKHSNITSKRALIENPPTFEQIKAKVVKCV